MLSMGELCSKPFINILLLFVFRNQSAQPLRPTQLIVFQDIVQHSSTADIPELCYS